MPSKHSTAGGYLVNTALLGSFGGSQWYCLGNWGEGFTKMVSLSREERRTPSSLRLTVVRAQLVCMTATGQQGAPKSAARPDPPSSYSPWAVFNACGRRAGPRSLLPARSCVARLAQMLGQPCGVNAFLSSEGSWKFGDGQCELSTLFARSRLLPDA